MPAAVEEYREPAAFSAGRRKILIVDDDECFRALACLILSEGGFQLREAANGVCALEQMKLTPPDLLITDLVMPEQEGIETIVKARRLFPDLKILAISGASSFEGYLRTAKLLGAQATLDKSLVREQLLPIVQALLSPSV